MKCKKACLIINPRDGQNLAKIPDILAVFAAAGWNTEIKLKEYGGHTMELATEAAEEGYDLIIAYGGDGTLNQVVNGVMNTKGQNSIVGLIPGGTANVWSGEIGVPGDPVKAALALVDSDVRKVDIGHIEVESLTFPETTQDNQQQNHKESQKKKTKATPKAKHHFLLMAGLGIDAAVMGHVSKPLKYRIGPLAVGASAAKELPKQHPFAVEIRAGALRGGDVLWKGEAIQIVIGNTRRYADVVEMTPNAYIDDGVLDICVITAGDPLSTTQQIMSLLLRRKPDNMTSEYFHGAHLTISIPASIDIQLDGSAVKLKDYLSKSDREALARAGDAEQVMVNYRVDAMPRALHVALPHTYDDALFEESAHTEEAAQQAEEAKAEASQEPADDTAQQNGQKSEKDLEHARTLLDNGRTVTVIGVSPNPAKKDAYIIAGTMAQQSTGAATPAAVTIDSNATMLKSTGENVSSAVVPKLHEGETILVEGKKSKRGVIRAKRIVV
jgi:YegS/Rv2252/BmrU family lipid kinase